MIRFESGGGSGGGGEEREVGELCGEAERRWALEPSPQLDSLTLFPPSLLLDPMQPHPQRPQDQHVKESPSCLEMIMGIALAILILPLCLRRFFHGE